MLQINRFSTSSIHHRHRKNNQNMTVYRNVKFGFVEYELFGLIDHHGVLVDNGHYTCFVYHDHCWYHCNDIKIEKAVLPSSSQNMYLLFYSRKWSYILICELILSVLQVKSWFKGALEVASPPLVHISLYQIAFLISYLFFYPLWTTLSFNIRYDYFWVCYRQLGSLHAFLFYHSNLEAILYVYGWFMTLLYTALTKDYSLSMGLHTVVLHTSLIFHQLLIRCSGISFTSRLK